MTRPYLAALLLLVLGCSSTLTASVNFQSPPAAYAGIQLTHAVISDLNADGNADVVGVGYNTLVVLLGKGDGTFESPISNTLTGADSLVAGDFNEDGIVDLAIPTDALLQGVALDILLGKGDGTFQPPVTYATDCTENIVAGDFNRDGHADLAIADLSGLCLLLGNGDGTFEPSYSAGRQTVENLAAADLDQDGNLDLVAQGPLLQVLYGNGDGSFGPAVTLNRGDAYLAVGDFNGDHFPDIASTLLHDVALYTNNGNRSFSGTFKHYAKQYINGLGAADIDGDGRADVLLTATYGHNSLSVYRGQADGTLAAPSSTLTALNPAAPVTGDLNNDGIPDVVLVGQSLYLTVLLGKGNATFNAPHLYDFYKPLGAAAGDFNGDGRPDVAVTVASGVAVMLNSGNGFLPARTINLGQQGGAVTAGDVNNDGKLDLVLTEGPNQTVVLLGAGDGTFTQAGSYPLSAIQFALADVNHDGKLDMVSTLGFAFVRLGNGDGTFQQALQLGHDVVSDTVVVGDVNGDGNPDVILGFGLGQVSGIGVLLGNGDGTFQDEMIFAPGYKLLSIALGDFDRDGALDLVGTVGNGPVIVFPGNGDGTFQVGNTYYTDTGGTSSLLAGDFDGDGLLDVVVNSDNSLVSVFTGNGDGTLAGPSQFPSVGMSGRLVDADFNGDGRLDIGAVGLESFLILKNLSR